MLHKRNMDLAFSNPVCMLLFSGGMMEVLTRCVLFLIRKKQGQGGGVRL